MSELDRLIEVMHILRSPGGCPWDGEQTHQTLVRYLIEETYELVDAIESGSRDELIEELGDVLYQVLFHADIASAYDPAETGRQPFDIQEVAKRSREKMVGRHPHVFAASGAVLNEDDAKKRVSTDQLLSDWEVMKLAEKPERESTLDGVPMAMPALLLADKLIGKAEKVVDPNLVIEIPQAEAEEFHNEAELGERLMSIVSEAKKRGLDAERALRARIRLLTEQIVTAENAEEPGDRFVGQGAE